jgi:TonB family protein
MARENEETSMAQTPPAPNGAPRHDSHEASGGGPLKWLAGAAVVAVLAVGGFLGWKTLSAEPNTSETAATSDAPFAPHTPQTETRMVPAATLPGAEPATFADSSSDELAPAAAPRKAAVKPAAKKQTAAASTSAVPIQEVGIVPATDDDPIVVTGQRRPVWSKTPTMRRLATAYPADALEAGKDGEASLSCIVQDGGMLAYQKVSEYPAREGFGRAALKVARMFRHAPELANGQSAIGSPVNLRVVFRVDDGKPRRT